MTGTQTVAFVLKLKPGSEAEYRRRHDALWPELKTLFAQSGILHYEIHLHAPTGMLFAFQTRREGHRPEVVANHPAMARWRAHMADILIQVDGRPFREDLECMFVFRPEGVGEG
jgi:L-rhamnose mutarotase